METKKFNETYERPLAELVDIFPEAGLCDTSSGGEGMDTDGYDDM